MQIPALNGRYTSTQRALRAKELSGSPRPGRSGCRRGDSVRSHARPRRYHGVPVCGQASLAPPGDSPIGGQTARRILSRQERRTPYRGQPGDSVEELDWLNLWAVWTQRLGRSTEDFWALTPREVSACIHQYRDAESIQNYRHGIIAAMVLNVHRSKESPRIWAWTDFFPSDELPAAAKPRSARLVELEFERVSQILEKNKNSGGS